MWYRRRSAAADKKLIARMVQVVLAKLKERASNYVREPATQLPYLIIARLRDELMQHELALTERLRIWAIVEQVVGKNANVRTSLEETADGEEALVWTWLGSL